jgi:hypothetical protein
MARPAAPFHYHAQDTQEILDPAVAILEHLDRVVKPAIGLCPDLDPNPWTILLLLPLDRIGPRMHDSIRIQSRLEAQ